MAKVIILATTFWDPYGSLDWTESHLGLSKSAPHRAMTISPCRQTTIFLEECNVGTLY